MTRDTRPRGEWVNTPFILRLLGFAAHRRTIYAHAMIGGGIDGWEYSHPSGGDHHGK